MAVRNRITIRDDAEHGPEKDVRVLEELLLDYAARFPDLNITIVELPPATV
jgi:hypothetical protein